MKTSQPSWHCIANQGDTDPLEHGGAFVLVDKRGVYTPELWVYAPDQKTLARVMLDLCTRCPSDENSVSDNRFHADSPAWFGEKKDLESVASFIGMSDWQFRDLLTSSNPLDRAEGYSALLSYWGAENFGGAEPITDKDVRLLCNVMRRQIAAAGNWKDGI